MPEVLLVVVPGILVLFSLGVLGLCLKLYTEIVKLRDTTASKMAGPPGPMGPKGDPGIGFNAAERQAMEGLWNVVHDHAKLLDAIVLRLDAKKSKS